MRFFVTKLLQYCGLLNGQLLRNFLQIFCGFKLARFSGLGLFRHEPPVYRGGILSNL
jgi:hypothetical protein